MFAGERAAAAEAASKAPPAKPGSVCVAPGRSNTSAAIGSPLDGTPDRAGPDGNEVNDVFVVVQRGTSGVAPTPLGFIATTFNHEEFYQFPVARPNTNGPIVLNVGTGALPTDADMPAAEWFARVDAALSAWRSGTQSDVEALQAATSFEKQARRSGSVSVTRCFAAPWDGLGSTP